MENYTKLVNLQRETSGATFYMGYSLKAGKHFVTFVNKKARFEHADINVALQEAIDWVTYNRMEQKNDTRYTMFNNR